MASLAISLSSAGVTQIHKMQGPKVRVMITKAVAIRAIFMVMVIGMGRSVVEPMLWKPISRRGI